MKSKVANDKEISGWRKKGPSCANCQHFKSKIERIRSKYVTWDDGYEKETHKRCGRYGFATGKVSWCKQHEFKREYS